MCDFCGQSDRHIKKCVGCQKDVCDQCGQYQFVDPWTGDDNGDYAPLICKSCDEALRPYYNTALAIRTRADADIEELEKRWRDECQRDT